MGVLLAIVSITRIIYVHGQSKDKFWPQNLHFGSKNPKIFWNYPKTNAPLYLTIKYQQKFQLRSPHHLKSCSTSVCLEKFWVLREFVFFFPLFPLDFLHFGLASKRVREIYLNEIKKTFKLHSKLTFDLF